MLYNRLKRSMLTLNGKQRRWGPSKSLVDSCVLEIQEGQKTDVCSSRPAGKFTRDLGAEGATSGVF